MADGKTLPFLAECRRCAATFDLEDGARYVATDHGVYGPYCDPCLKESVEDPYNLEGCEDELAEASEYIA